MKIPTNGSQPTTVFLIWLFLCCIQSVPAQQTSGSLAIATGGGGSSYEGGAIYSSVGSNNYYTNYTGITLTGSGTLLVGSGITGGTIGDGVLSLITGTPSGSDTFLLQADSGLQGLSGGVVTTGQINHVLFIVAGSGSYTYAGTITDMSLTHDSVLSLIKQGTGTQVLSGNNTYAGGTTLAGGGLQVGSANALGGGPISFTGGTLQYGTGVTQDLSAQFGTGANQLYSIDTHGQNVTIASNLTSSGGSLTKLGQGMLTLTGTNTYSGGTTISGGVLEIASETNIGGPDANGITLSGGVLLTTSTTSLSEVITLAAGTNALAASTGTTVTYVNLISGAGAVTIGDGTNLGTVVFANSNNYGGGTTIASGMLQVNKSNSLGTGAVMVQSGATLKLLAADLNDYNDWVYVPNNITISGIGAQGQGAISGVNGESLAFEAITGTVALAANATVVTDNELSFGAIDLSNHTLTVGNGTGSFSIQGPITGSGGLVINASYVTILGGNNTFTGATEVLSCNKLELDDATGIAISDNLTIESGSHVYDRLGEQLAANTVITLNGGSFRFDGGDYYGPASGGTLGTAFAMPLVESSSSTGGITLYPVLETIAGLQGISTSSVVSTAGYEASFHSYAVLTLAGNGNYSYAGQIEDESHDLGGPVLSLIKQGTGTQILSGNNSYTGGTTLAGGILQAGSATALGTGSISFTGGTLQYGAGITQDFSAQFSTDDHQLYSIDTNGQNVTFASNLTSTGGSLTKLGEGRLILTGANTYTGGTTISAGILQGNTASLQGDIVDNASLVFDQVETGNYSGKLSGSGSLTKQNTGTMLLSGTNTYSGGTTINAGTLIAGSSSALGTGDLTVNDGTLDLNGHNLSVANLSGTGGAITSSTGAGILTVNETMDPIYAGTISGPMAVVYNGTNASNLVLTGTNTYTGGTTITGGTVVAGNTSAFGTGNLALTGGVLTVGTTPSGTLHIGGNYVQGPGATLALTVSSSTVYNSLTISGTAQLGGTLNLNLLGGHAPGAGQTFNLIQADGGITGQFASITGNLPALRFNINGNVLSLQQASLAQFAQTPNQVSAATYIDAHDLGAMTPGFASLVGALNSASGNLSTLAANFDQLTPLKFANFTSSIAFNNTSFSVQQLDGYLANHRGADGSFVSSNGGIDYSGLSINDPNTATGLQSVRSRLLAWSPAPSTGLISDTVDPVFGGVDMKDAKTSGSTSSAHVWNVFAAGNVVLAQDFSNASAGIPYAHSTTGAVQIGADYRITPHWCVGALFGYGHTHATLDTFGSDATVDTYSPGAYASYSEGGWYANALGSYGFSNYSQNRSVAIGAFNGTATSSPGGDQIVGNLDGGYDFHQGNWTFGPTLGLQYVHLDVNGYTETGLPGADLTVSQNEGDSLRSRLGGQVSYAIKSGSLIFTPRFSASWQHECLNQSRGITSQFNSVGAGSFIVNTPNPSRESALADLGLDAQINRTCTLFTDYSVQVGQSNYFGQSVQAGVKIGF